MTDEQTDTLVNDLIKQAADAVSKVKELNVYAQEYYSAAIAKSNLAIAMLLCQVLERMPPRIVIEEAPKQNNEYGIDTAPTVTCERCDASYPAKLDECYACYIEAENT